MEQAINKIRALLEVESIEVFMLGFSDGSVIELARGGKKSVWFNIFDVLTFSAGRKIIIAHNHPVSGKSRPSIADRTATRKLQALLGDNLVDHIIVTKTDTLSMKGEGYLKR